MVVFPLFPGGIDGARLIWRLMPAAARAIVNRAYGWRISLIRDRKIDSRDHAASEHKPSKNKEDS